MTSSGARWQGVSTAELEWGEDGFPRSSRYHDIYYASNDGLEESRHVFLDGNDLPRRWHEHRGEVFNIAETGFGTGLNFLATWERWRAESPAGKRLHYLSIERFPLKREDLARALAKWPGLSDVGEALLRQYPPPLPGRHRLLFDAGELCLDLVFDAAEDALSSLSQLPDLVVDAWYLDGFAPARNPEMWNQAVRQSLAQLSAPGSRFATFTAAGDVRRGLQTAGFRVEKRPGFGRKREMLCGEYHPKTPARRPQPATWLPRATAPPATREALVIGAGLAGASAAAALARRGWHVAVMDRDTVASAASGNSQGVLYTRISHRPSALNTFSLHSYCHAVREYRELLHAGQLQPGVDGELCGALHLLPDWDEQHPLFDTVTSLPGLVEALDATAAAVKTGLESCPGGLFYPGAGWLHPPSVCRTLLRHPAIHVLENCGPVALRRSGEQWLALDQHGKELQRAAVAIVACGAQSLDFDGLAWLPLQAVRGQVTQLPASGALSRLRTVVCHDGYIAPARAGEHCIGATFDLGDAHAAPRSEQHSDNVARLREALPVLAGSLDPLDPQALQGRVGFRCASPDYLPLVGPAPDYQAFCRDFAPLRHNARARVDSAGSYLPGLYLSTAHGSRGLTSTPLASELLAAQICGEPWPLSADLCAALAPARFIIRDLIRNRIPR